MLKLLVGSLCMLSVAVVRADAEAAPDFAAETLTGDWGGARSTAAHHGYRWEAGLKVDSLRNRGAQRNGSKSVSHLDLKLTMDLEKAAGWAGMTAVVNLISNSGTGLAPGYVNNQMGITNIEVGAPTTTRLFQAWVQKSLFDDQLTVLLGLYPVDAEFSTMGSAGVFLGPQYGPPTDLAQTRGGTGPSIFNNAGFGIRARWNVTPTVYAMGAVLDGVPNDPAHPQRTAIRFKAGDGHFNIGEMGWQPPAENDGFAGHAKLALGFWQYSARVNDQLDVAHIDAGNIAGPAQRRRSLGGYLLGEHTLFRLDTDRYLSGFARYTWTDGDTTAVKDSVNLGLHLKGPLAWRHDDILGLAWSRAGMSSKWRDAQTVGGNATLTHEDITELTYRYAATPWLAIQPNVQHVRHPGAAVGVRSARLIGLRLDLAL